ncbi:MAG TPA: elongation factor 4 [candidate division Zixibacteria bacterium]|nr:elongation factor 4 [candidate division Zixibacteria bacterium]
MKNSKYIRNFSIIAHIDHGKSTLADRILELTGAVEIGAHVEQLLDNMELERERGITIKSHAIKMDYKASDGEVYELNLIDTPGHVDFTYEVSRSLAACEGALIIVDATQGIEAQTISNLYLAIENDLEIIPVVNKIDMPAARPEDVAVEIAELLGCDIGDVLMVSAKTGEGVPDVVEAIVKRIPPPEDNLDAPPRALIFDSFYDTYRGVVVYARVVDGTFSLGDKIKFFVTEKQYEIDELGYLTLSLEKTDSLSTGEVGYLMANVKSVGDARVGDTITTVKNSADKPLPGYREVKPMVYSGFYPTNPDDFEGLRSALEKLKLNDASLVYEPETSAALGFGFRCGFLGLLHLEITQERLFREYDLDLVATVPNVEYIVMKEDGEKVTVENPAKMPDPLEIESVEEPFVEAEIITPHEFVSPIMNLVKERRGEYVATEFIDPARVLLRFNIPLAEVIFDFFDKMKTVSRGYGSFDYKLIGYRPSDLVKLDVRVNGDLVDALSIIIHRERTYDWGQKLVSKLKELIPRQMYEVVIQAAIGTRVISRARCAPLRKNVTAKCYGGDISRKRKLLERQKEGKRRMKMVGSVEIPQDAFFAVLKIER